MFWQKKEKGLPELPPLPEIPRKPIKNDRSNELPRFPDSPDERGFSQSMIKEAVAPTSLPKPVKSETETLEIMPPSKYKVVEMEDWKPSRLPEPIPIRSIPTPPEVKTPVSPAPVSPPRAEKSVFVKLDKFYEAKATLELVQEKLREIDQVMLKIKEVKSKEEEELEHSEKEIEMIKARINSILKGLFDTK